MGDAASDRCCVITPLLTCLTGAKAAAAFYNPKLTTEDRAAALSKVLHLQPAIWDQLVIAFHESCKASNLVEELALLGKRICSGDHLMPLMDSALSKLQLRFNSMAIAFLAQLCSEDGLIGLAQDSTGSVAALLRLMQMPKPSDELALRPGIQNSSQTFCCRFVSSIQIAA